MCALEYGGTHVEMLRRTSDIWTDEYVVEICQEFIAMLKSNIKNEAFAE